MAQEHDSILSLRRLIESRYKTWLAVLLTLPLKQVILVSEVCKRSRQQVINGSDIVVALVASDFAIRKKIIELLSTLEIQTTTFTSGKSVIKSHQLEKTDCLIIETELDDMPGVSLFKKLLINHYGLPPTIFIGVSRGCTMEAVEAMTLGAIDYIEKPFSSRQLIVSLKIALEAKH